MSSLINDAVMSSISARGVSTRKIELFTTSIVFLDENCKICHCNFKHYLNKRIPWNFGAFLVITKFGAQQFNWVHSSYFLTDIHTYILTEPEVRLVLSTSSISTCRITQTIMNNLNNPDLVYQCFKATTMYTWLPGVALEVLYTSAVTSSVKL